jgi:hypothetical protein
MYDLEILVPFSSKTLGRVDNFKRFGLVNMADRRVRLNAVLSHDEIADIESGWHGNVTLNIVSSDNPCHVSNLYRFYAEMDAESLDSRWFARLDDDTCTDVDGLVSNLDLMYDWESPFHLGELNGFSDALAAREGLLYPQYRHLLGEYERLAPFLKNEIECGITSRAGLARTLGNESSRRLLEFRAGLEGGYGDCVFAIAAVMAGVHPIDCPFLTHEPLVHEFSTLDGIYNHIHMIAAKGENFSSSRRASSLAMQLLIKSILKAPSEMERAVMGSRYLLETAKELNVFEFRPNYSLKIKFERRTRGWFELDGEIVVVDDGSEEHRFSLDENGDLVGKVTLRRL